MKFKDTNTRTLLNIFFAGFGVGLLLWIAYLGNYAFFCNLHFEDSEARFLVLGDPQMEGDSRVLRQGIYGQIDLMYNDAYFRHIVSNIMKYLSPTHVFVLGDLFSSQYISDSEFDARLKRYESIFESVNVPIYNITGNHDLGYAGEVTPYRLQRFEKGFGKVNDEVIIAGHVIGIVNSLNVDASLHKELQEQTWEHIGKLSTLSKENNMPLIMMTHIPLHKETFEEKNFEDIWTKERKLELCTERSYTVLDSKGHIDVQNMITPESTQTILDSMAPLFVFSGHDHDGCIYRHNEQTIEYTIRSMMGQYGGYAGMFEIRRNPPSDPEPFSYSYTPCAFVSTTTTTVTLIVAAVFVLIAASVNVIFTMLPHKRGKYEDEYAARYIDEVDGHVKAKSA